MTGWAMVHLAHPAKLALIMISTHHTPHVPISSTTNISMQ